MVAGRLTVLQADITTLSVDAFDEVTLVAFAAADLAVLSAAGDP
jgi:hypothetical protein